LKYTPKAAWSFSLDEDGDAVITLEQHVSGGVTSKNLLQWRSKL